MGHTFAGTLRRLLGKWGWIRPPSNLQVAILRVHRVQTWFQYHRGKPLVILPCPTCEKCQMFTIWADGKYYCLACYYAQIDGRREGPVPLGTDEAAMRDFTDAWTGNLRHVETYEDPWNPPSASALIVLNRITRVRPPPVCDVGDCAECDGIRPFMRREDGDGGCVYCFMRGRIVEFEIVDDETAAA